MHPISGDNLVIRLPERNILSCFLFGLGLRYNNFSGGETCAAL